MDARIFMAGWIIGFLMWPGAVLTGVGINQLLIEIRNHKK